MLPRSLGPRTGSAPFIARVALGLVMFPHGAQHALGLFGGYGFEGTLAWMTGTLGFPTALGIIGIMLGAITTHAPNGFFMNWFGALPAGHEGFEYHLIAIALAVVVVLEGSGIFSVEGLLHRRAA